MKTLHKPIFLQWISKVDAKNISVNKTLETVTKPASFQCRLYSIEGADGKCSSVHYKICLSGSAASVSLQHSFYSMSFIRKKCEIVEAK